MGSWQGLDAGAGLSGPIGMPVCSQARYGAGLYGGVGPLRHSYLDRLFVVGLQLHRSYLMGHNALQFMTFRRMEPRLAKVRYVPLQIGVRTQVFQNGFTALRDSRIVFPTLFAADHHKMPVFGSMQARGCGPHLLPGRAAGGALGSTQMVQIAADAIARLRNRGQREEGEESGGSESLE